MASYVKIIAVPPGQAPLAIRQEWVGMTLPVAENLPPDTIEIGVFGGELNPNDRNGYPVETALAIQELEKQGRPETAKWWRTNLDTTQPPWLSFPHYVCRFIS